MKKITLISALLLVLFAAAQLKNPAIVKRTVAVKAAPAVAATPPPAAFSAYVSCWAFNKPCNFQKTYLSSAERILKDQGLVIFDPANNNNVSVAGYNSEKRVMVTVICVPAPNNRTSLILNVFSDDGNVIKTMGELFRQKFEGTTMIDCG